MDTEDAVAMPTGAQGESSEPRGPISFSLTLPRTSPGRLGRREEPEVDGFRSSRHVEDRRSETFCPSCQRRLLRVAYNLDPVA